MSKDSTSEAAALRLSIGRHEQELEAALKDVVRVAEARASLGHYFARRPWQVLVGGLIVGIWLERSSRRAK